MARRRSTRRERRRDRTLRDRLPALQEGLVDVARPQANPLAALGGFATGWTPVIDELVAAGQQKFHEARSDAAGGTVVPLTAEAETTRSIDHAA